MIIGTIWDRLTAVRAWRIQGCGDHATMTLTTADAAHRFAAASVRQKAGESLDQMVFRGLNVLDERLEHGMPPSKYKPKCAICESQLSSLQKFGEFYLCDRCNAGTGPRA
jgi:hypothetical protein